MKVRSLVVVAGLAFVPVLAASCSGGGGGKPCGIVTNLDASVCALGGGPFTTNVTNPYFPLRVGTALVLEGLDEGENIHLEILTLTSTEMVSGVVTRVVRETETIDGELYEISWNYFAQAIDGTVCYFGEDVLFYENGVVVGTDGSWRAGGANQPGIQMPAVPHVGDAYSQEIAPGIAEDRAQVLSTNGTVTVPAGTFNGVLRNLECNPLELDSDEYKEYAPGVGLIVDAAVRLTDF